MKAVLIVSIVAAALAIQAPGDQCQIPATFVADNVNGAATTTGCNGPRAGYLVELVCVNPLVNSPTTVRTTLTQSNAANQLANGVAGATAGGCFVPSEAVNVPTGAAGQTAGTVANNGVNVGTTATSFAASCTGATPTSNPLFPASPFLKGINVMCDTGNGFFQTAGVSGTQICASTVVAATANPAVVDGNTRYFTNIVTANTGVGTAGTTPGQFIPPLFLAGPNAPLQTSTANGGQPLTCAQACVLPATICTGAGVFNPALSVFNFFAPVTGTGFGTGNGAVVAPVAPVAPAPVAPQTVATSGPNGQFNGANSGFGQNGVVPGTCLVRPGTTVSIVQNFGQGNGQAGSVTNPFQFTCPLTGGLNAGTFVGGVAPAFVVDGAITGIIIQASTSFGVQTTGGTPSAPVVTTPSTVVAPAQIVLPTPLSLRSAGRRQTVNNLNNFPGVSATVTNSGAIALGQFGGSRISANVINGQTTAAAFQNGNIQTVTVTGCEQLANRAACVQAALNELRCQGLVIDSSTACFAGLVLIACPTPALGFSCNNNNNGSKKGLLGLLGLLGLIPLLLCCLLLFCCLIPCCLRRRKTEADVHFATFDPHAAPVAASVIAPSAVGFGGPAFGGPAFGGPTAVF